MSREEVLHALVTEWDEFDSCQLVPDTQWAQELAQYPEDLAEMRIDHVRAWVKSNLMRFQAGHACHGAPTDPRERCDRLEE